MSTVLIVDDFPSVRMFHRQLLQSRGWTCFEAGNGEEGLQVLERTPVNLVVLDWLMPGMGGAEFLQRLRSRPAGRSVPVVVISSEQTGLTLDGDGVRALVKPVKPSDLLAAAAQLGSGKGLS